MKCSVAADVIFAVDLQDPFVTHLTDPDKLLSRASFLLKAANILGVPIIASEQVPDRLGATHAAIRSLVPPPFAKDTFSSLGNPEIRAHWQSLSRNRALIIGAETHICVLQTALDLKSDGAEVMVCADAVASRHTEAHNLALERLKQNGVIIGHTESVVYEWLETSKNTRFREVLGLVKEHAL